MYFGGLSRTYSLWPCVLWRMLPSGVCCGAEFKNYKGFGITCCLHVGTHCQSTQLWWCVTWHCSVKPVPSLDTLLCSPLIFFFLSIFRFSLFYSFLRLDFLFLRVFSFHHCFFFLHHSLSFWGTFSFIASQFSSFCPSLFLYSLSYLFFQFFRCLILFRATSRIQGGW